MDRKGEKIIKADRILAERYGIPERPARFPDPVEMLVATILSQNTNDNNSFRAYKNLKEKFSSFDEIAKAPLSLIEKTISVAGLTRQKASAIKNFLSTLKKEKGGITLDYIREIGEEEAIEEMIRFKGVGVKTASCVLLFALDRNVCPVDTHVNRIVNRLGIVKASTPDNTFYLLNKNFPAKIAHSFHTNLIKLGRELCKPQKPACSLCPFTKMCIYKEKNFEKVTKTVKREFMLLDNVDSGMKGKK